MRALIFLVVITCILSPCLCRPQQMEYVNENPDEAEEDDNEPEIDDSLTEDEDARLSDHEPSVQEPRKPHLTESNHKQQREHSPLADLDNFSGYKLNSEREEARTPRRIFSFKKRNDKNPANSNAQFPSSLKTHPSYKYTNVVHPTNIDDDDSTDTQEATQYSNNRDVNNANVPQDQPKSVLDKRTVHFDQSLNEEADSSFGTKDGVSNDNNNEALDAREQERYIKQYYNTMQAENRDMMEDNNQESDHFELRDRRDTKEFNHGETLNGLNKDVLDRSGNEDDEAAIKRHIKKLTGDELEQLLNSLSDDKRELLKKIISESDTVDTGNLNKREITKKAGAVEENNLVEAGQSDLNKVQSDSISAEGYSETSVSSNSDTTETSKKTDNCDISSSKPDISKVEINKNGDVGANKPFDTDSLSSNTDIKVQVSEVATNLPKKEGKREINMDEMENFESSFDDSDALRNNINLNDYNDEEQSCYQEENLSQLQGSDSELQDENSGMLKREALLENQSDLSDSMKSLEESFPDSSAYDDSVPYSGPLVRVKRENTDQVIKKRSAALLPEAKVAYFPYKAENEDEDRDEGNEFDNEGFYDRTANFANNHQAVEDVPDKSETLGRLKQAEVDESKTSMDNPESDMMSIGSDTDSVLSGAEGVDDNLMYRSGSRKKRTAENNSVEDDATKLSRSMENIIKAPSDNCMNLPHYQEIDAFGPLPRSNEGDSGRYKRIRRVKQSHNPDDSITV